MGKVRSITDSEKEQKRALIKECALTLFEKENTLPSADKIAKSVGMAKGTLYLYFKTKEEVFLEILSDSFAGWFEQMGQLDFSIVDNPRDLSKILTGAFLENPSFISLASIGPSVLERNVPVEKILEFKTMLLAGLSHFAEKLQAAFPMIAKGEMERHLIHTYVVVMGYWQQFDANCQLEEIKSRPEYKKLFVEQDNLEDTLTFYWTGVLASKSLK